MMKKFLVILLLNSFLSFAQEKDIFTIARSGTVEEAELFLKNNSEAINKVNEFGFSPLILACYKGKYELAEFFIKTKANLDYVSEEGTALMAATVKGDVRLTELLLSKGANPNLTNFEGITALMYATQFKNEAIVKLLLQYKADKTLLDKQGRTAFEFAVFSKNENIINQLK